jgi:Ca2+-dependent lipid-binding protein
VDEGHISESHNAGSGQSVSIVIGSGGVKWIIGFMAFGIVMLTLLLITTTRASVSAEIRAGLAQKAADNMATELRLAQYWIQRTKMDLDSKGMHTQPLPASWGNN